MIAVVVSIAIAQAGDLHAGIPVDAVGVLGDPVFLEPGWSAPVLDETAGEVRVYVHRDEESVQDWFSAWCREHEGLPPLPVGADEGLGNGHTIAAFRDGNVAVVVHRPGGGALDLAVRLHGALEDDVPWPQPPMVHVNGAHVSVDGMWKNVAIRPAPRVDPKTYMPRPVRVVPTSTTAAVLGEEPRSVNVIVWDRYGRTASTQWTEPTAMGTR